MAKRSAATKSRRSTNFCILISSGEDRLVGWAKALARHFHCDQAYRAPCPRGLSHLLGCVTAWARRYACVRGHVCAFGSRLCPPYDYGNRVPHSPNTNSMGWLRCSFSSGVNTCLLSAMRLSPARIATYCLPLTSKVIGGALKPTPTLTFQSCCNVVSS